MDYPLEHHDVLTNDLRLHVVQCGPPDGPLVILLHGFPEYWYSWRAQLPALVAAGYRVWVPDQRGYNLSDKPLGVESYVLPTLAADIIGLIDVAGRAQAAVVGHDWGAIVAWYLAAHHQSRIACTTIINVPHPRAVLPNIWQAPDQLLRSWYIAFFQLPGLPERLISRRNWQVGAQMLVRSSRPGTFSPAEVARYKAAWNRPGAITSMLNWYRALTRPPVSNWPHIRRPVQVIWGERDAFLNKKFAQLSLAECEQATLHYFPQATHWVHLEEATKVNELLLQFLQPESTVPLTT
jgi:pimeloyl-ACP methyl ester carboxylesterase